jgi:pimeloyl-ACP methyl ester carboxylesterase
MRRGAAAMGGLLLGIPAILGLVIVVDTPHRPRGTAETNASPDVATAMVAESPPPQTITARDGARLSYRAYKGNSGHIVVLVHGSTGSSLEMNKLALALQGAGATVYSISLRGHSGSGTRAGDVSYVGQLEDDLADLAKALNIDGPGRRRTLIGFSAGGGFALKVASGPQRRLFDSYVAVAPYFVVDPAREPRNNGWVAVATYRARAIRLLASIGLPQFEGLVVASYAIDPKADEQRTPDYSYRLLMSLRLDRDWRTALARIESPTRIVLGADDALVKADQAGAFSSLNPQVKLIVLPALDHTDMINKPSALAEVVSVWRSLNGL